MTAIPVRDHVDSTVALTRHAERALEARARELRERVIPELAASLTTPVAPAVTPVIAWCERCSGGFPLLALVQHGTGACPHCRQPLAPEHTAVLVELASVVDAAYGRLVTALQELAHLPGHLKINTEQLARTLPEDADV